ncbi:hypothetical protein VRU48_07600 [Pedobacter sp. KR3-3]|uniref:Uncharacterized protein n=1 Tax=Pedobacter albus TaxID=3113905 RepID=A0ABU7I664_9SPHI|nr:hypothetical protein [Pedobacter sp. KR3-3]MEE1944965.1 hypothetical protein [Pedobacter sp. KR3-3]
MKTTARYLVLALTAALCLFSGFKPEVNQPKQLRKVWPPIVVTENFTADNGVPGSASISYTAGQVYTGVQATIQGLGTINLTSVSHSPGTINVDKFEGYVAGSYYEYYIYVTVSGSPTLGWRIDSATATSIVI